MSVHDRIAEIRREINFCERSGEIGNDLATILREELEFLITVKL